MKMIKELGPRVSTAVRVLWMPAFFCTLVAANILQETDFQTELDKRWAQRQQMDYLEVPPVSVADPAQALLDEHNRLMASELQERAVEESDEDRDYAALEAIAALSRHMQATGAPRESLSAVEQRLSTQGGTRELARKILAQAQILQGMDQRFAIGARASEQQIVAERLAAPQASRLEAAIDEFAVRHSQFRNIIATLQQAYDANSAGATAQALFELRDFMAQHQSANAFPATDVAQVKQQLPAVYRQIQPLMFETQFDAWRKEQPQSAGITLRAPEAVLTRAAPGPEFLGESDEVILTPMIRAKATELENNPVKILDFVRNRFEFLPTFGAAQSAEQMMLNRRGNAADTSTVLIALLRAAQIPARYVYGTVQLPSERVQNWLGNVSSPNLALELMQRGGIPASGVVSGGRIASIRFAHVWVEAYVDNAPSRGSVNRAAHEWVPMDASFRQYTYTAPISTTGMGIPTPQDTLQAMIASGIQGPDGSITGMSFAPMEQLGNKMDEARVSLSNANPELTIEDLVGRKVLIPEHRSLLELGTPFQVISASLASFAAMPDSLRHFVEIRYFHSYNEFNLESPEFTARVSFASTYAKPLQIDYVGSTAADQQALTQYEQQNALALSASTLFVRPVLKHGTEVIKTGGPARFGTERFAAAYVIEPFGNVIAPYKPTALPLGSVAEAGTDPGFVSVWAVDEIDKRAPTIERGISEGLHLASLSYWSSIDHSDEIVCRIHQTWCNRLPSVGWFVSHITPRYFFGIPRTASWSGFLTDIPVMRISQVASRPGQLQQAMLDMGLQSSYQEVGVWEGLLGMPAGRGASATSVLVQANESRVPIYVITAENQATILPRLQLGADAMNDIRNGLNANMKVIAPEREIAMAGGWRGAGWIIIDPQTGSAAYRIEGGQNGAMLLVGCLKKAVRRLINFMKRLVRKYNRMWARFLRLGPAWSRLTAVGGRILGGVTQVLASNYVFSLALQLTITDMTLELAGAWCPIDEEPGDDCLLNMSDGNKQARRLAAGGGRSGRNCSRRPCRGGGFGGGGPGGGGAGAPGGGRTGKPIDIANGFEIWQETDFESMVGTLPLVFTRTYISDDENDDAMGKRWRHNYEIRLNFDESRAPDGSPNRALVTLGNGDYYEFSYRNGAYVTQDNFPDTLEHIGSTWRYTDSDDLRHNFDAEGVLQSIQNRFGVAVTMHYNAEGYLSEIRDAYQRKLTLHYNDDGRLIGMTDPAQREFQYVYNSNARLAEVRFPNLTSKKYGYTDARDSRRLTSITDERNIVLGTIHYAFDGRADYSSYADGVDAASLRYEDLATVVTDALGTERRYEIVEINTERLVTKVSQPCVGCSAGGIASVRLNAAAYPTESTDFRGNKTLFTFNTRGLLERRIDASSSALARTTITQWHPILRLPTKIVEPVSGGNRITEMSYAGNGTLQTKKITAPNSEGVSEERVWQYSYNSEGQLLSVDGPRTDVSDVSSYTYHPDGTLKSSTNALGHTTHYTLYSATGKLREKTDVNGLITRFEYDEMDRLLEVSTQVGSGPVERTVNVFTPTGKLASITSPDSSVLTFTYDNADRLTAVTDSQGQAQRFTLNAQGDQTKIELLDASGNVVKTSSFAYDALGRMRAETGATVEETTAYTFDENGNIRSLSDPLQQLTTLRYDELNRFSGSTDAESNDLTFKYDVQDNIVEVIDPRSLKTNYLFSGFDELKKRASPDTGIAEFRYDLAGNLKTEKDARNVLTSYQYDAANRVTEIVYPALTGANPQPAETLRFSYDQASGGVGAKGQLTMASDATSTTQFAYDAHGRLVSKRQTIAGQNIDQSMRYKATGQLDEHTLPSGAVVKYSYRADGLVVGISVNGHFIIRDIDYFAFGAPKSWKLGASGAGTYAREFDLNGRIKSHSISTAIRTASFDAAGRITAIEDSAAGPNQWQFSYDALDRLDGAENASTSGPTAGLKLGWSYDDNGNRVSETRATGIAPAISTAYSIDALSNRLNQVGTLQRSYDAVGNTLNDGSTQSQYSSRNRLIQTTKAGQTTIYTYNAFGERIRKIVGGVETQFVYDGKGHILGEYDNVGQLISEYVWLNDVPVAVIKPQSYISSHQGQSASTVAVFYIEPDHLDTPRAVLNSADQIVWRWDSAPFGDTLANEQPTASLTSFRFNLRRPGQQFDSETGLHYNYYRDYEPGVGRFVQSDPMGIDDGPDTYSYVDSNPLGAFDPDGQAKVPRSAKRELERFRKSCKSDCKRTFAVCVDTKTGDRAFGKSGGGGSIFVPAPIGQKVPNPSLEKWHRFNCAETAAAAQLVGRGSNIDNVRCYAIDEFGNRKPPCRNCRPTYGSGR